MTRSEVEQQIIDNYERDEQMMILIFAQWCVNHDLDPAELYHRAYPKQGDNYRLQQAIDLTVPKEEAGPIPDDTLFAVLSMYNNEDLAFVVSEELEKMKQAHNK
ncbi:hypothetical protein M3661_10260 [Paenibacillus sp. MER 180]|uniref:hypothetical protein n=1 Tax=unclassified Paenibacillus TaxID=185978 RepID=UPI0008066DC3|nr:MULTISPECIES: hypothetical protein [unclassified Paenibacillus]MCM3290514.1 hypothetical protein [Paenibacillus sp. MER 180]OBY80204.1 hypothetical protein BBG47_07280 [Paenibacillus sp. KS1]